MPASKDIKLFIPNNIWGADYSQQITNLQIKNGINNVNGTVKILDQKKNLVITYEIINLPKQRFINHFGCTYYHYIANDKFYLLGMGAFIYPQSAPYQN